MLMGTCEIGDRIIKREEWNWIGRRLRGVPRIGQRERFNMGEGTTAPWESGPDSRKGTEKIKRNSD